MEKLALLRFVENWSLQRYFHGRGVEIGALWRRFPLPRRARVWYIDRLGGDGLEEHYPELKGRILQPDLLADAAELPLALASLDFLIASHLLEHLQFPKAALRAGTISWRPEASYCSGCPTSATPSINAAPAHHWLTC